MSLMTKIGWTDATWNPAIGCTKVSPGCKFCYMMRERGGRYGEDVNGNVRRASASTFNAPLRWQKNGVTCVDGSPLKVFTSSLTDIFHPAIDDYRHEIWDIIRKCPDLVFQILTKRPERIADNLPKDWGVGWPNVWLGFSAENQATLEKRIYELHKVNATVKFISFEPLLGRIEIKDLMHSEQVQCHDCGEVRGIPEEDDGVVVEPTCFECNGEKVSKDLSGIDWAIIGGESGNESGDWLYRECDIYWIDELIEDLQKAKVKIFVKQLGTAISKQLKAENIEIDRHGTDLSNLPPALKYLNLREIPRI